MQGSLACAALLALLTLSGCLDGAGGSASDFQVPTLPENFQAAYEDSSGQRLELSGATRTVLDRHGRPSPTLLVRLDRAGQESVTFALDVCGASAWVGREDGDADDPRIQLSGVPVMSPV